MFFFVCRIPTTHGLEQGDIPKNMLNKWAQWVGKYHIIRLPEAKAIVDILLGVISITAGSRTWATYLDDLKERGQTEQRIQVVQNSLSPNTHQSENCLIQ